MYLPTFHPGLYERPQQTPFLDIGALFKLLFRPKEAFEELYDHTSAAQGYILAIVFIVIIAMLGLAANLAILGSWDQPEDAAVPGLTGGGNAVLSVIGIFTGILFFWITAWMFHGFIKTKSRQPSMDKTIGMMGYAKFPAFIISSIIAIVMPITMIGFADGTDDPETAIGAICGTLALIFGLGIIGLFWAFWVHSHAQSVANDMSNSSAFGWLFLTWFLVYLIQAAVGLALAFVVIGSTI